MKFCSKCGKELVDEAVICPHCGCMVEAAPKMPAANDTVSVGLVILSVLIPLFGIIYWPAVHEKTPKRGKACGIAGLISWGVSILITIISVAISAAASL